MPISFSPPADRDLRARGAGVTAVLGPTNTGKTHLGIERMLAHSSGLIGLPLRLLAREVYNRAVERVGADAVALVTGEGKIKPPNPRFWVATVEDMPRDLDGGFLVGDEKLTRLPRRPAVVAFSAEEVYAIAELIRRQRGGAAVVLGSLSPRTRKGQGALYPAGDGR